MIRKIKIFIVSLFLIAHLNVPFALSATNNEKGVEKILEDLSSVNFADKCTQEELKTFSSHDYLNSIGVANSLDRQSISISSCENFYRIKEAASKAKVDISISKKEAIKLSLMSSIDNQRSRADFAVMLKKDFYKDLRDINKSLKKNFGETILIEKNIYGLILDLGKMDDALLINEGDITNNIDSDNEQCVFSRSFKNMVMHNYNGISNYPVVASTMSAENGKSFKEKFENLKTLYPSVVGELEVVEKEKRYFTVKELKNLFGRTVGVLILDPKEKIKNKMGAHNIYSAVKMYLSFEGNPSQKYVIDNWNDGSCPVSYNPLEIRRNLLSECHLCKYLYSLNNTFMTTAELFFQFIKSGIVGFLIIIFSLWIALKFYENIRIPESFNPKKYVTSMFRKPIRIAFFFAIIFSSPRFLANTFFYPIVMIGTSSMQLTIEALEKAEENFMSSEEREIVTNKRFCDPENEFRRFLSNQKNKADKFAEEEGVKLFPRSQEILSRKSDLSSSGSSSYQASLKNKDINSIEVTDGEYYIGQMTCGIKSIKKMFATNRVLGELMLEDAINKVDINLINLGVFAMFKLNPLIGMVGDAANIGISSIILTGSTPITEIILEACLGLALILISFLIVLYIFFTFFELMVEIAFKIMILPIGIIFWCFGKDLHKDILNDMKNFALEFFKLALRMSFIFLIYKASVTFLLGLSINDISQAFVYGSKSYILNSIDISHLSFLDLLFIIIINVYIITNIPDYVENVIGGVRSGYEGAAEKFVENTRKKLTKATPTAYKVGKKFISKRRDSS